MNPKIIFFFSILFLMHSCSQKQNENQPEPKTIRKYKTDISDPSNTLSGKTETLELQYIAFGCPCANWIDVKKYKNLPENEPLGDKTIFIEPAEKSLELPKSFDLTKHKIVIKGQFYTKPDYPKGTPETEATTATTFNKAPVFRYTEIKIENL